jgi:hypothetical protein
MDFFYVSPSFPLSVTSPFFKRVKIFYWCVRGTVTPKDRDEVNRREVARTTEKTLGTGTPKDRD